MLLAIDLHEDFINEERFDAALVFSFQTSGIHSPKLDAPEANGLIADSGAAPG